MHTTWIRDGATRGPTAAASARFLVLPGIANECTCLFATQRTRRRRLNGERDRTGVNLCLNFGSKFKTGAASERAAPGFVSPRLLVLAKLLDVQVGEFSRAAY